ncbi:hypothetical protein [Nocardia sp. NPDC050435]|uniref:hypothetical protein n=1 Tax=Nocardia sp. NPDC050435 TaxID=3155040 RepID=UPI0033F880FF
MMTRATALGDHTRHSVTDTDDHTGMDTADAWSHPITADPVTVTTESEPTPPPVTLQKVTITPEDHTPSDPITEAIEAGDGVIKAMVAAICDVLDDVTVKPARVLGLLRDRGVDTSRETVTRAIKSWREARATADPSDGHTSTIYAFPLTRERAERVTSDDTTPADLPPVNLDPSERTADLPRLTPEQEARLEAELTALTAAAYSTQPQAVTVTPWNTSPVTAPAAAKAVTPALGDHHDRGDVTITLHPAVTSARPMVASTDHAAAAVTVTPPSPAVTPGSAGATVTDDAVSRDDRPSWVAAACYAVAAVALLVQLDASWRFFGEVLHVSTRYQERYIMFAVAELALLVSGAGMAYNITKHGRPGAFRAMVWAGVGASSYIAWAMSDTPKEALGRIILGPLLSAAMLHLGLGIKLRERHQQSTGTMARIGRELRERWLSRLGLADDARDAAQRTRDRAAARAAVLSRPRRIPFSRAARLERALMAAAVADDPQMRDKMLARLAVIRHAQELTALDQASPWATTESR